MADRPILIDFPDEIVGERIVVRPFRDEDAPALYDAIQESQEHLRPFMIWYDAHQTVGDSLAYIRRTRADITVRNSFQMGMFERESGRFLGGHGLGVHDWLTPSFEIGYWIRRPEEGKGYVTEATKLVTAFAFEQLGASRLVIRCNMENVRSARIPERLGFMREGTLRNVEIDTSGRLATFALYAMVPEDYRRAVPLWGQAMRLGRGESAILISLATGSEEELRTRDQLRDLLDTHDLRGMTFTREARIERGAIPHSHPILTLSTRHLGQDDLLLATYLHEQLHWYVGEHGEREEAAIEELREVYPAVPVGFPEGARDQYSSYLHLIICWLEYQALIEVLGHEEARRIIEVWTRDHYTEIYAMVLKDPQIGAVVSRHFEPP